ncbi:Xanthine dehydrogenase, molybdenum binding subunit [Thioalkalivibrio nitratireducens DSM 14787]|uniref:Xanthine dehydrogenase, molybdenum binding subunit n=1 Tax=Thioalkalivibrio nitratireducens (strain DSM 14787 / UNIQEM 213 / ALEN2) TaxID=1255043 RepID=L0DWK1_THIND|nr:molybdopterin cofactor-binding domain-containing protein [Thioalkalivibrio nitratireducens]AGA33377.1 Xanthine dehydrogenase, molybdenum binding subunit [Thioalkalivibrio nitratireducens DSM 14787]
MIRFDDSALHARGESRFVDDIPAPTGLLQAAVATSPVAHGRVLAIDTAAALAVDGVLAIFTARDIPGENQIGNVIPDEPLLADTEVTYVGQPLALVVATSAEAARLGALAVDPNIEVFPALFDAREAYRQGALIAPERCFAIGDTEAAWAQCDVIVEGRADSGAQEHVYLETQAALAVPVEQGQLRLFSATQSPGAVQKTAARVLGCPMNRVEVDVLRLGGGFGGKEDQATGWAVMAALAADRLQRPVKLVLDRREDMTRTGKRHPYSSDFKIGLTRDGVIVAYQVRFYQNAGAYADLSTAILERSLLHVTNAYHIPNVTAHGASCLTHLPPNTAFRGFGAPQAMFVMEAALYQAAVRMGLDPAVIQHRNLLNEGHVLPYGMAVANARSMTCWHELERRCQLERQRAAVDRFNAGSHWVKKGFALMPICFGISFSSTFLNQASALVHVYTDGSVSVSCGAVEMGQGVKTKIQRVAARVFSLPLERVKVESTNTTRIANMSPTAASVNADMNGQATRLACEVIVERLKSVAATLLDADAADISLRQGTVHRRGAPTALDWLSLITETHAQRVALSAHAHYATPHIYFDRQQEKGRPFLYHVFGVAAVTVSLDCLRGIYQVEGVNVVHDVGQSLDPVVDRGQVEGGVVQGLGWMTLEEIRHDAEGRLLTNTLTTYKIPDIQFAPEITVHFLENADNPSGLFHSKAIGEPPFMYGIGAYFALLNAVRAFRADVEPTFDAPWTPEKILMTLCDDGH